MFASTKGLVRSTMERLPGGGRAVWKARLLVSMFRNPTGYPPGHYHSPIPSFAEVKQHESEVFAVPDSLPAVDFNEEEQLELFEALATFFAENPFAPAAVDEPRYHHPNEWFPVGDALILYAMIRHLRPRRVMEIGSGFSSAVILDTNERFFGGDIRCTFIEPNPDRLLEMIRADDQKMMTLFRCRLQDVPKEEFLVLERGDILFVDSSHVGKIGSDVNAILFEVIPRLAPGVVVHFHDIFYPFEYPREWVYAGRAWNEAYLLHAFLLFNDVFKVRLFTDFLSVRHGDVLSKLPAGTRDFGGSIWLERMR